MIYILKTDAIMMLEYFINMKMLMKVTMNL